MKQILLFTTAILLLVACKTSKDYLSRADEDRTLFDVVKALNKRNKQDAATALPTVYTQVQNKHLKKINTYKNSTSLNSWDKIIDEYSALQKIYNAINDNDVAYSIITPTNYYSELQQAKMQAADAYYNAGEELLQSNYRNDAKTAYAYFKKVNNYIPNYKDARAKMDDAFANATVNILINPVQDNSFFFNTGLGNYGYNYSNEYFQQTLIRDLGGKNSSRYPAKFYTEWEARRDNVQPDWVVDLTLRNMDIPRPITYNYTRNASTKVQDGKDTSGNIIYKTVTATVHITRQSFTARAQMDVNITDVASRKNISYNTYSDDYSWQQEVASYTGDSRALSNNDWALVNNRYNQPTKEEVLNELYRKIYPQVRNNITYMVDW